MNAQTPLYIAAEKRNPHQTKHHIWIRFADYDDWSFPRTYYQTDGVNTESERLVRPLCGQDGKSEPVDAPYMDAVSIPELLEREREGGLCQRCTNSLKVREILPSRRQQRGY